MLLSSMRLAHESVKSHGEAKGDTEAKAVLHHVAQAHGCQLGLIPHVPQAHGVRKLVEPRKGACRCFKGLGRT